MIDMMVPGVSSKVLAVGFGAVGFEEVEEEGLGFAFFVAFEIGGELSEGLERLFLRGHSLRNCRNSD